MEKDQLQQHIFSTYVSLRYGLAVIAIAFPIILVAAGWCFNIPMQDSMSAYFHADEDGSFLRTFFVGCLFAIGVGLHLYKGYSDNENIALNLAGIFSVGVAIFPMTWVENNGDVVYQGIELFKVGEGAISAHGLSAVLMLLCVGYVCIFCSSKTLEHMNDGKIKDRFIKGYWVLGFAMILFPLIAVGLALILGGPDKIVIAVEVAAIVTFAIYWILKSFEIRKTRAEAKALKGQFLMAKKSA